MPKLLWVASPLLLAAALLGVLALRGRLPSRHALNVGSSLLLMAYVLVTAGLGIFWVANQQLPVFDWHYLFGYGTVLLVTLHLVFNLPAALRYVVRRRRTAEAPPAPGRRAALGTLGVLATAGAAFALGMRHGRTELRLDATTSGDAAPVDASAAALSLVERFHAFSSHSRAGVLRRAPSIEWGDPPPAFKRYAGVARVALPPAGASRAAAADLASLGAVLWHSAGVTDARTRLNLRASPSSGALFATELYVAARDVRGLEPGLWHYDPSSHALERLPGAPPDDAALGLAGPAPAVVVATAVFRRTGYKYRDRTLRYVLADLGHALENLRVAAAAVGADAQFAAAFDESEIAAALHVDEAEEGVLAVAAVRPAGQARPSTAAGAPPRWSVPRLAGAASAPFGVTGAMHAATSLRALRPGAVPRALPPRPDPRAAPSGAIALPRLAPVRADPLALIAARRSVRRFARTPLPQDALAAVLAELRLAEPPVLSSAVRVDVVLHDVDGLAPGAYRYDPTRHALQPIRAAQALRDVARAAALDQDVIGEAAAAFVLSIDRAAFAADPLGPARGYRHAFLEAGFVGERIYLAAAARGLGACAVGAFYDDEAAALVGLDRAREWPVHFAALGIPR